MGKEPRGTQETRPRGDEEGLQGSPGPRDSGPRASLEGGGRHRKQRGRRVRARLALSRCQQVRAAGPAARTRPFPPPLRSALRTRKPRRIGGPRGPRGCQSRPPRPHPRATAEMLPEGNREEGPRPRQRPEAARAKQKPNAKKRNTARPAPPCPALPDPELLCLPERDGCHFPRPHRGPGRPADQSPPPTASPPLVCPPARPPGTRPAPPLAAAHRAEADPAGWLCRHLERATKPGPASAATRLGGRER